MLRAERSAAASVRRPGRGNARAILDEIPVVLHFQGARAAAAVNSVGPLGDGGRGAGVHDEIVVGLKANLVRTLPVGVGGPERCGALVKDEVAVGLHDRFEAAIR